MKLWYKIVLIMMVTLLTSLALCGGITIYQMNRYNLKGSVSNYGKQLEAVSYTFEQFCSQDELREMNRIVKNAYLQFQFRKCCGVGYALFQGDRSVVNLTGYDIINISALQLDESKIGEDADYRLQKLNGKDILLMKKKLEALEGYEILQIRDITEIKEQTKKQVLVFSSIYMGISIIAALFIIPIVRHTLKPLRELEKAAVSISRGELDRRVEVESKDEVGFVGAAFNQMAEKIEQQVDELQDVSEKRKMLLGSLTHELKTPMTSIMGYSETLLRAKLADEQRESALLHIHQECKRLEQLSAKMMNLLGLYENDAIQMRWQPIELLFRTVGEIEKYNFKQKNIVFSSECSLQNLFIDFELMESLLINLIDNAVKASPIGGHVSLRGYKNRIEVEDEGRGIPKQEIKKVTEAFYMVDKSRSRREGGVGLGLALCSQIAHLHQAVLYIESEPEQGTKIIIEFPERMEVY